jgi:hypothetical protein
VPIGLLVLGFLGFAIGGFVVWHRQSETPKTGPEAPALEQIPERTEVLR